MHVGGRVPTAFVRLKLDTWYLDVKVQQTIKPQSQVSSIADINASHLFKMMQEKAA